MTLMADDDFEVDVERYLFSRAHSAYWNSSKCVAVPCHLDPPTGDSATAFINQAVALSCIRRIRP